MIFLDTHAVVWLFEKNFKAFSPYGLECIKHAPIAVSPMAVLELSYLFEIKRISHTASQITTALTSEIGLAIDDTPFAEVVETATGITWTRDPFDRLIVAQAQCNDAPLLTKDNTLISGYDQAFWE